MPSQTDRLTTTAPAEAALVAGIPPPLACLLRLCRLYMTGAYTVYRGRPNEPWRLRMEVTPAEGLSDAYAMYLSRDEAVVSTVQRLLDQWWCADAIDRATWKRAIHMEIMLTKIILLSYLGDTCGGRRAYNDIFDRAWLQEDRVAFDSLMACASKVRAWRLEDMV